MSPNFPFQTWYSSNSDATEFILLNNFQLLVDGGIAGMFWTYCWIIPAQFFIVLSLAEMSSMAPTAGGLAIDSLQWLFLILTADIRQYHWVSEFASRKYQKILSYASGWLSSLSWQSFAASNAIFGAQLLMALVEIQNPDFVIQDWYTALLSILIITMVTAFNILGAKKLALAEKAFVTLHVACFFIFLITIAVASPKTNAKEVFLDFSFNGGNYPLSMFHPDLDQTYLDAMDIIGFVLPKGASKLTWDPQRALRSWPAKYQAYGIF